MTLKTSSLRLICLPIAMLLVVGDALLLGQEEARLTLKEINLILAVTDYGPKELAHKERQLYQDAPSYYPEFTELLRTSNNDAIIKRILLLFSGEKKDKALLAPPVRDFLIKEWTALCADPKRRDSCASTAVMALGEIGDASDGELLVSILRQRAWIGTDLKQQTIQSVIKTSDQRTPGLLTSLLSGNKETDQEIVDLRERVVLHLQQKH